jgi:hypothetical protein
MQAIDLGNVVERFRTSRVQAVVLFVVAGLLFGVAGLMRWMDDRGMNLLPVTLIAAGGALYFVWWGARLSVPILEVRERGVSMRLLTRRIDIPYDQIESVEALRREVNGLPASYCAVWIARRDGSAVEFPLESAVPEAVSLIERAISVRGAEQVVGESADP